MRLGELLAVYDDMRVAPNLSETQITGLYEGDARGLIIEDRTDTIRKMTEVLDKEVLCFAFKDNELRVLVDCKNN